MLLLTLLVATSWSQVKIPEPELDQVAVRAFQQIETQLRNPYAEFYCSERGATNAGAASAACNDLHAFACSQEVVRDPLSASYSIETKMTEFSKATEKALGPVFSEALSSVVASNPALAPQVQTLESIAGGREALTNCMYRRMADRLKMVKGALDRCKSVEATPEWKALFDVQAISDLGYVVFKSFNRFVIESEKHRVTRDVIFPKAKELTAQLIDEQARLNPARAAAFQAMREKILGVELAEPSEEWVGEDSNMYADVENNKVICNHSSIVKGSFGDIAHGIVHELAHNIDPCIGVVPMVGGADGLTFPLQDVLLCMERETQLSMGVVSDGEYVCRNGGESFSDFVATMVIPKLLPSIYGSTLKTPDDYAQVYSGIARSFPGFCEDITDGSHPTWAKRINMLVGSNPVIRAQMGCSEVLVPGSACFNEARDATAR